MPERIAFVAEGTLGRLRLVRPEARNAIDMRWVQELVAAVDAAQAADIRALLIEAEGPSFTVGGDLAHFGEHLHRLAEELEAMVVPFHDALARLAELPLPVVCAVRGAVAGGGVGLLWPADVVIAAEDFALATSFDALGLSGDGGSSFYLPRLCGTRRALEIALEGRRIDAATALDWGLVTRVVPVDALDEEAQRTARRLADGPTVALGHLRRLYRENPDRTLRDALDAELAGQLACAATQDTPAAMAAFLRRERPTFTGR